MSTKLNHLTIIEAKEGLKSRHFSSVDLVSAHLRAMEKHRSLNAYITETAELALEQAKKSDIKINNATASVLEGIPLAIKDIFCTKGVRTTCASKMLDNFVPTYESTVTDKLFKAGTIMLGKANLDEFAMGSSNYTSYYGGVINPWKEEGSNEDLVAGGSSGGSAAAVAARLAMAATGTDTGGSVRLPGAFCGIVGFKPSYGRCSRYGVIAFASSLDQPGVFARNVPDAALVSQVMMGHDLKDSTSANLPVPDLMGAMYKGVKGMKIGIPKEYRSDRLDPEIAKLWQHAENILKAEGAEVIEVSLPNTQYGVAAYYVIAPAEASSNLARYDGVRYGYRAKGENMTLDEMYEYTRSEGFGDEVRRRLMIGTYVLSAGFYDAYFSQAQKVRRLIINDFNEVFTKVDALLTPVTPTPAFSLDSPSMHDPIAMYLNDIFTIPASMAGLPCMSIPGGLTNKKLPIGLQIITNRFEEGKLFRVASELERCVNFKETPGGI
jgi:aspartyl-tRNA(Asn)/glutamyl-tRNA(Gln) amidotransferase subunit A